MDFKIEQKLKNSLARAGIFVSDHGVVETPAFVAVGTKATVKALAPEDVANLGAQVVLANTYHLLLEPGPEIVRAHGGLHAFMHWQGPIMTDSGGFQVFSLGAALGHGVSKITSNPSPEVPPPETTEVEPLGTEVEPLGNKTDTSRHQSIRAEISEEGVKFRSHRDGSKWFLTPERSMQVQHDLGADIIFAFDECTSPLAEEAYQREAMERTHRWATRSLHEHKQLKRNDPLPYVQALFGIVQGGRHQELREASARAIGAMEFAGFGIGGSFSKEDMGTAVRWVNTILPEEKPRHLLGIGDPRDLFEAVANGSDLFDCVAPTRMARNGSLYTHHGVINIFNAGFRADLAPIDEQCSCSVCAPPHGLPYTRSYLAHLFHAQELLAYRLASIHNLSFIVTLVHRMRQAVLDGNFFELREKFVSNYAKI